MSDQPIAPFGLLVIDKPEGPTSMTVCAIIRRKLRAGDAPKRIKVGHGGTLDPLATGVLVILVGSATRLCEQVMAGEKRYLATIDLSQVSTTDDREGQKTLISVDHPPSRQQVEQACLRFTGTIAQVPPAYSAIKVEGQRAYRLARKGKSPELKARPVDVHAIDVLDYAWPSLTLDIRCGKGTYIRSLARDIGASMGAGGMLAGLRRTAVGRWTIELARDLDQLPERLGQGDLLPAEP
jgi:tRNA pseudouridine55 synthase